MSENNVKALSDEAKEQLRGSEVRGSGFGGVYPRLPKIYREKLSKPLPAEAIKKHPSKTFLSTIKAIYIIERLNDVFGINGWDFEHEIVGIYDNTVGDDKKPQVIACGRIYLREFDLYTPIQYGGKDIDGKGQEPADGFKSAVTDALTKCASFLEIGIQVFKGKPTDQTPNKSKRLDPSETPVKQEEPTPEPQSEEPESFEPVDPEPDIMEKLRERHKEVFGKYPNKNWSKEVIHQRIEDELNQPDPEPEEEVEDPVFTTETAEEMHARVEEEDKAEPAESFEPVNEPEPALKANEDFDAEAVDEEPSYHGDAFSQATQKVQAYTDPAELKESAGQIVFEAELEGANEDEIKQLKLVINNQYLHLVNGSE